MEGSVDVDSGAMPTDSSQTEVEVKDTVDTVDTKDTGADTKVEATESKEGEDKVEYTEKGTKLDPNPLSAAHQELANERKLRGQYETVLRDPEKLKRYAAEMGLTLAEAKEEIKDKQDEFTADKFQTAEDIAKALNEIRSSFTAKTSSYEKTIKDLQTELRGLGEARTVERVGATITQDISSVREKYPELDPKNASYDPELEKEIGQLYTELDYDAQSGNFRGNVSIAKLTDRVMRAAGKARQKGSQEAQTVIKERRAGAIVTSSKVSDKGEGESSDPGTTIAARIAKSMGK